MVKKVTNGFLFLFIVLVYIFTLALQCGAQEELINARLCYGEYFTPYGISYDNAVTYFGDNDASTACYMSQLTNTTLPKLRDVFIGCGRDWFRVMVHFGVDPEVLFIPVPPTYRVGPPYGNAYGYWKKHMANPSYKIFLTSNDVVNLANLNILYRHYKTPVVDIMNYRAQNKSFHWIAGNEYKKHGKGQYKVNINPGGTHVKFNDSGKGNTHTNDNKGHDKGKQGNSGHGKPKKK